MMNNRRLDVDKVYSLLDKGVRKFPAYSGISLWLENYAYRTPVVWWVFVVPVVLILLLALATIGAQTAKVAFKNPVESLKCE